MDRVVDTDGAGGGLVDLPGRGLHMPAEVLGQAESPSKESSVQHPQSEKKKPVLVTNVNARSRKRAEAAVKATQSQAASAAAAAHYGLEIGANTSSMITLLTFGGVEVVFSTTSSVLVGVCSRTHFVFQKLYLTSDAPVVSLTSNSTSGLLVVAHQDGIIQTYQPERTDPNKNSFGKYIWVNGLTIEASKVFYQEGDRETPQFFDRRHAPPGQLIDIATSADHKLLVAHKNQLAVFETLAKRDPMSPRSTGGRLLWTTMLAQNIVTAKISGDGQAIVAVLEDDTDVEDNSPGARTFIHDLEDGSLAQPTLERSTSIGMVFKPGPFLKHTKPVTRISFRGQGRNISSTRTDGQGNDLLLTYCKSDSAVRIFNQNGWRQLMLWVAPPNSRADWIRGCAAFSLGDLESEKKKKTSSRAPSRRPSGGSDISGGINSGLRNSASSPTTAAGAWIAEITFRGAFPALRLSRLSYMKRGKDDTQPAHFESVAAILPAGSIAAGSVLNSDEMGIAIQGIWPAWNPWLSEPVANYPHDDTLRGSAMEFLGLSSMPPSHSQYFGESYLGGTHSPPTELRITAAHAAIGNVAIMEFPLWGDDDFGAMELGSPLRSVLSLSDALPESASYATLSNPSVSVDCESSRLSAQLDADQRSISLLWREQGAQSVYSSHYLQDDSIFPRSIMNEKAPAAPVLFEDKSVCAAPLALPSLRLPSGTSSVNAEKIVCLKWWPDGSYDGPPLLLALTRSATLMVFEIPPPRSIREPAMPNFDPFNVSSRGSVDDEDNCGSCSDGETDLDRPEYEVSVTPHPDFGLGLRLESPMDGLPAVAGSFKKHPLNGGMLPAEKTGMIVIGDEVLSVNGVSLENMTFDDIISTVRHVGAKAGPGQPLVMRFRPTPPDRSRKNSAVIHDSFKPAESVPSSETVTDRRAIIGVSPKSRKHHKHRRNHSDGGSLASMLVGSHGEAQQEFGRVIAVIRKAVPSFGDEFSLSRRFIVTPWKRVSFSPDDKSSGPMPVNNIRSTALILFALGNKVMAKMLILPGEVDPDQARLVDLESLHLEEEREIRAIWPVACGGGDPCYVVADDVGTATMFFVEDQSTAVSKASGSSKIPVHFRKHRVFSLGKDSKSFDIFPASIDLFVVFERGVATSSKPNILRVFTGRPDPACRRAKSDDTVQDDFYGQDFVEETVDVQSSMADFFDVRDIKFLQTGHLDSFPLLVVFAASEALIYRRCIGHGKWTPISRIAYSLTPSSFSFDEEDHGTVNPCDTFPHLLPMIQTIVPSYDEVSGMLSDWHPETLLAFLCTDDRGAKIAMKEYVVKIIHLLADLVSSSSTDDNILCTRSTLIVAPFELIGGPTLQQESDVEGSGLTILRETASALFSVQSNRVGMQREDDKLEKLLTILGDIRNYRRKTTQQIGSKSREFRIAMSVQKEENVGGLPPQIQAFPAAELRVLWAITELVKNPPDFDGIDPKGQLSLAIFSLHNSLKKSPDERRAQTATSPYINNNGMPSFFQRNRASSSFQEKCKLSPQSASTGAVAALLSDYQGHLVDKTRGSGEKLNWATVRETRMAFWIRSDEKLRQVAEEVGQRLYRESRDILTAAIFFLAAGKLRTLRNLAAADATESGKKFFAFLTSFDFSSERGRSAAEKNAFSLLRKNKYESAAAFFLLSQPPMLKSAVETIAAKMEDLDLAFMVSRLIGNAQVEDGSPVRLGLGGSLAFGGVFSGGGGYAGASIPSAVELEKDHVSFEEWTPTLSKDAKALVESRMLPNMSTDGPFCALLLLWLERRDEAWHWLSGFVHRKSGIFAEFRKYVSFERLHETTSAAKKSQDPTIEMTNAYINFVSAPLLLKEMKAAPRTRVATAMMVASSLRNQGIELPAIRSVINAASSSRESDTGSCEPTPKARSSGTFWATNGSVPSKNYSKNAVAKESSIFDSFDGPPKPLKEQKPTPVVGKAESSIFDSFDTRPSKPKSHHNSGGMTSSIFDSFDAPPKPVKTKTVAQEAQMASSIFNAFETAAPPTKAITPSSHGQTASSIFDSFAVAPSKPPVVPNAQENMASSIFDAFDGQKPAATPASSTAKPSSSEVRAETEHPPEPLRPLPSVWDEWRHQLLASCAARRLLREVATFGSRFHIDEFQPTISPGGKYNSPIIPGNTAQILQAHAAGSNIVDNIRSCLHHVSEASGVKAKTIVEEALHILDSPYHLHRICIAALLHIAINEEDEAEDIVRRAAHVLIKKCSSFSFLNNDIASSRLSTSHLGSLPQRHIATHMSWQLEICLWLNRGGVFPMSGLALNECICAVRVGMLIASWNRDFELPETMIKQPADCTTDEKTGRQLCTSLKIISNSVALEKRASSVGSGGWEFLVDCKRAEATELLRPRQTGCFIIRPHPEDHGVFTLSFKTNLIPNVDSEDKAHPSSKSGGENSESQPATPSKSVKRDDIVQHAIIRLSDSGFRCGSFGPFATLMKLLEAVSTSLPFKLRFDLPPTQGVIKEDGSKPSPNCAFFRKLGLNEGRRILPDSVHEEISCPSEFNEISRSPNRSMNSEAPPSEDSRESRTRLQRFGLFTELVVLSEIRKQLSAIAAAKYDTNSWIEADDLDSIGSADREEMGPEQDYRVASRLLRPFLIWCRSLELSVVDELAPSIEKLSAQDDAKLQTVKLAKNQTGSPDDGDGLIRKMIKSGSGVEFRTLRLGEGGETAMLVLFSKKQAIDWFINNNVCEDEGGAKTRLTSMEQNRVIESVDFKLLAPKMYKKQQNPQSASTENDEGTDEVDLQGIRYRLVDPWEVEPLENREAETRGASLGRLRFHPFGLGKVAASSSNVLRNIGGQQLLELWAAASGSVALTKALATVHPSWERGAGGDLRLKNGVVSEAEPYDNSIRQHLYRNSLFRRLGLPQRFVALIQVELLDLKNLTSPGGSLSLTAYSLLRLKRPNSKAPLTMKARTLDSVATTPTKLGNATGPNAPASWGSLVRFRFPLPEDTSCDGRSNDSHRESLFKGAPSVLQVSVYEKKFMSDSLLGGADVKLDGLSSGGQLEEWVPLRTETHGINWFARIRLTLRFELMCLSPESSSATREAADAMAPSVGLRRIKQLSSAGGLHEDVKRSASTPDLLSYFESMVY